MTYTFVFDPIYVVNLILCILIFALAIASFVRNRNLAFLFIGLAFFLFGFSHLVFILGLHVELEIALVVIRMIAYLLVVVGIARSF